MKNFSHVFHSTPRPEVTDPVFGLLVREDAVWQGEAHAEGPPFAVFVVAGPEGPSDQQRAVFKSVVDRRQFLTDVALRYIQTQAHGEFAELRLAALEIGPDAEAIENRFTLELSPVAQSAVHRIEFKNNEPVGYSSDD